LLKNHNIARLGFIQLQYEAICYYTVLIEMGRLEIKTVKYKEYDRIYLIK